MPKKKKKSDTKIKNQQRKLLLPVWKDQLNFGINLIYNLELGQNFISAQLFINVSPL